MNFYLETIQSEAVMDIGQYIPLSGVIVPESLLIAQEADVKTVLDSIAEVLPSDVSMLVNLMPSNFRRMLEEARKLKVKYPALVPMFTADPQSFMAVKACRTARIPAAVSDILYLEQGWIADANQAALLVINMKAAAECSDPVELIKNLKPLYDKVLVAGMENPAQVRLCMMLGVQNIAISEDLAKAMLENPASRSLAAGMRENWVMTYTRDTLLDPEL